MACWAGVKSKKHDSRFGQFSNFLSIGKAVRPPNSQYFSLLLPDKEEEMQKYQEQLKFLFGQTIHWILLMPLKRFKGGFSMTWAALADIYLYPEKSKRAPFWFFHWKKINQNLIWFSLSFSLLISNVVMYQNIFHFSRRLPEKVNFDIWVSLKVRCRDYEETCQARQLTWSQENIHQEEENALGSAPDFSLPSTALYSYRSQLEDIPLSWLQLLLHFDVPTVNIYALGNIKPDICRWVSLQKTWLLIRVSLLFPLKNPFRPSTALCVIFLWRTSKAPGEIFIFR